MATVEERLAGLERGYEHMATKADVVALASEMRLLKNETVKVRLLTGRDTYNQPTYSAEYARDGNQVTPSAVVVIDSATAIPATAQVTLPNGEKPRIVESNCMNGLNGLKVCVLKLGK